VDRWLHLSGDMNARGFTLVETLVAISITALALTSLAQLFVIATRANTDARRATFASILAAEKIEQLRSLGPDLAPAGLSSLSANIPGACDFLDGYGRSLGTGTSPLPGTVYIRRWSVESIASDPDTFVVQVAVFPSLWRGAVDPRASDARSFGGAQIATVKTRRAG
jgi:prepilin-type N-terminal cleavage/methylation domain-containing protein